MHKEHCLLYAAGEMEPGEAARFRAHLPACPGCKEWMDVVAQGHAWAQQAAENAPVGLSGAAMAHAVLDPGKPGGGSQGAGGSGIPGWLSFLLISAVATAALWGVQKLAEPASEPTRLPSFAPKPMLEASGQAPGENRLDPGPKGRSGRMDLVSAPKAPAAPSAPERPLACGDAQAVLDFARLVAYMFGPPYGDEWPACLCGLDSGPRVGSVPQAEPPYAIPACPSRPAGPVTPETLRQMEDVHIEAAKYFYKLLPLDQRQAARLAACYCGPLPEPEEDGR